MTITVTHDASRQRFETTVDGQLCVLDYRMQGQVMWMTHTGVPEAAGGRGIAAELVRVGLEHARANGMRVEPACSYVASYVRKHPEWQDLLAR